MSLRQTAAGRGLYRILDSYVLPAAQVLFKTPDHFTWLALALAALAPVGFWLHPGAGFFVLGLSGLTDCLDGLMARKMNMQTIYGSFLDSSLDRVSDFFFLCGFWVLFDGSPHFVWASVGVFSAFLFTVMISYTRARAEGLGIACEAGFFERGARTVYLVAWALALAVFPSAFHVLLWLGLCLFCLLTLATVIQRMSYIRKHAKAMDMATES